MKPTDPNPITRIRFLLISLMMIFATSGSAQTPTCQDDSRYQALDFWLGQWRVVDQQGDFQGDNHIESILDGCAVLEHWTSSSGNKGMSLFYVTDDQWHQVWVTPFARVPGGIKEKHEVSTFEGAGIRFKGEIQNQDGSHYLDRTSLRPLEEGKVHQLIEVSTDGGKNWKVTFDAIYLPVSNK